MITRRLFSRRAPLAAALPMTLHQTAGSMGNAPPKGPGFSGSTTSIGGDPGYDKKWNAFELLRRPHRERIWQQEQQMHLLGGLDPDLFALRSMPITQKVRLQAERNRQRNRDNDSLMKMLAEKVGVTWHG